MYQPKIVCRRLPFIWRTGPYCRIRVRRPRARRVQTVLKSSGSIRATALTATKTFMRTERPEVRKIMELTGAHFFIYLFIIFFYEKKRPDVTALLCIVDGLGIDVACFVKKTLFVHQNFV